MSACVLYHFAFDPGSRAVRLALGEAKKEFTETLVRPWEDDCPLDGLNPSGMPPVLQVTENSRSLTLCEPAAILGWLEDGSRDPFLMPTDPSERAETRRLIGWFDRRFTDEVNAVLLHERMEKPLLRLGSPDARALRAWCRDRLAVYMVPRIVEIWAALPRLPNGKLDKRAVAEAPPDPERHDRP